MPNEINLPDFTQNELEQAENNFLSSIRNNPNNFSYWFPKIAGCGIPVPESVIIQLPDEIIRSLFLEREGDDDRITEFVKNTVKPTIPKKWGIQNFWLDLGHRYIFPVKMKRG